jgi:hypothetical protein
MLEQSYNALETEAIRECSAPTENLLVEGSRVRACPDDVRKGFKVFKYKVWFQSDSDVHMLSHLPEAGNIRTLAKFRCGAHNLLCEAGRDLGARSSRICSFCDKHVIEDELHCKIDSSNYSGTRNNIDDPLKGYFKLAKKGIILLLFSNLSKKSVILKIPFLSRV